MALNPEQNTQYQQWQNMSGNYTTTPEEWLQMQQSWVGSPQYNQMNQQFLQSAAVHSGQGNPMMSTWVSPNIVQPQQTVSPPQTQTSNTSYTGQTSFGPGGNYYAQNPNVTSQPPPSTSTVANGPYNQGTQFGPGGNYYAQNPFVSGTQFGPGGNYYAQYPWVGQPFATGGYDPMPNQSFGAWGSYANPLASMMQNRGGTIGYTSRGLAPQTGGAMQRPQNAAFGGYRPQFGGYRPQQYGGYGGYGQGYGGYGFGQRRGLLW